MSRPTRQTLTAGSTPSVAVDVNRPYFVMSVAAIVTGTVDYTVEHTFDDIWEEGWDPSTAVWFPHDEANLVGATTSQTGNFMAPPTAVRCTLNSGDGSVEFVTIQQGVGA